MQPSGIGQYLVCTACVVHINCLVVCCPRPALPGPALPGPAHGFSGQTYPGDAIDWVLEVLAGRGLGWVGLGVLMSSWSPNLTSASTSAPQGRGGPHAGQDTHQDDGGHAAGWTRQT